MHDAFLAMPWYDMLIFAFVALSLGSLLFFVLCCAMLSCRYDRFTSSYWFRSFRQALGIDGINTLFTAYVFGRYHTDPLINVHWVRVAYISSHLTVWFGMIALLNAGMF